MTGTVVGGWGFVASAYVVTLLVLGSYAYSVFHRYRAEQRRALKEGRP